MPSIEYVLTISLAAVLGYLSRILVEHFLSKSRAREERIAAHQFQSANDFRDKVVSALAGLYPELTEPVNYVAPRLSEALPKIQAAVALYSMNIDERRSKLLWKSFEAFRQAAGDEIPRLCSMAERMYGKNSVSSALTLLRDRVNELLRHTG